MYRELNKKHRAELKSIITLYTELMTRLLEKYNKLKMSVKEANDSRDRLLQEFSKKAHSLLEIPTDPDMVHITKLQEDVSALEKELEKKEREIELNKDNAQVCKLHFKDALHETMQARNELNALRDDTTRKMGFLSGFNSSETERKQIVAEVEHALRQRTRETAKKIVKQNGLHVLVRFRCAKKSPESHDNYIKWTSNSITMISEDRKTEDKIAFDKADFKGFLIYDDSPQQDCLKLIKGANTKYEYDENGIDRKTDWAFDSDTYNRINEKLFALFDEHTTLMEAKNPKKDTTKWKEDVMLLNTLLNQILNLKIAFADKVAERVRYDVVGEAMDDEISAQSITLLEKYSQTRDRIVAEMKSETRGKPAVTKTRLIANMNDAIHYMDFLHQYIEIQATAHKYIINVGELFVKKSALSFVEEDNPSNPIRCVTILGMGSTGSGKTTSTRAILLRIIHDYTTLPKWSEALRGATIKVTAKQVREGVHGIEITELSSTPPQGAKLSKPFLIGRTNRSQVASSQVLCGVEDECNSLTKLKGYEMMKKLIDYDQQTEKNRDTRYTPHNPAGSSRSVKITTITIKFANNKVTTINLIDPPGYERYEKKELEEYYANLISKTNEYDPNYKKIPKPKNQATLFADEAMAEKIFIDNTTAYIKKYLKEYATLQKTGVSQADFDEKMEAITQTSAIPSIYANWITHENLMPKDSTVIVVTAFKAFISKPEVEANYKMFEFLKELQ